MPKRRKQGGGAMHTGLIFIPEFIIADQFLYGHKYSWNSWNTRRGSLIAIIHTKEFCLELFSQWQSASLLGHHHWWFFFLLFCCCLFRLQYSLSKIQQQCTFEFWNKNYHVTSFSVIRIYNWEGKKFNNIYPFGKSSHLILNVKKQWITL